jgi:hypothetical protein
MARNRRDNERTAVDVQGSSNKSLYAGEHVSGEFRGTGRDV